MDEKPNRTQIIIHAALLALFMGGIVFLTIKYGPLITRLMSRPEQSREFIASYGAAGPLIFIAIQMAQIVVFIIPGEVVQVAGGYIFGTPLGTLYSVIGAVLGTLIAFMAVRVLGFALIKLFIPKKTLEKFEFLINSPKSEIALFALFLAPGIPKDALTYIAGLTPIKPLRFLVISMLGRFPGLLGSAYVGAHLAKKNYWPAVIVGAISLVLFLLGLAFKDRIIAAVRRRDPGRNGGKSGDAG
jgi:uncharacterized membrane protein YdjX (TVP38/TMEM64 family)